MNRLLEWVAISFSRGSSRPRDRTWVSSLAGGFFTFCATSEAPDQAAQLIPLTAFFPLCETDLVITVLPSIRAFESLTPDTVKVLCPAAVQSLCCVRFVATPWTAAHQASLSITNSQSLYMSILCPLSW